VTNNHVNSSNSLCVAPSAALYSIHFHDASRNVISADKKIVKIWNKNTGAPFTAIEPEADINHVCLLKDTGMMIMAVEQPKMQIYYTPALGPAPKWCSFLDSLTEELEEQTAPTVYDDYKFVTRDELEKLGMSSLIGTNLLRAYMHGFFVHSKLYNQAKSAIDPFSYDKFRNEKIKEKIEQTRLNRITRVKKKPQVNAKFADALQEKEDPAASNNAEDPLSDDRFKAMFSEHDFEINEESEEYKFLHPAARMKGPKQPTALNQHFTNIGDEDEQVDAKEPKLYELKQGHSFDMSGKKKVLSSQADKATKNKSLGERMLEPSNSKQNELSQSGSLTWEVDIPEKKQSANRRRRKDDTDPNDDKADKAGSGKGKKKRQS